MTFQPVISIPALLLFLILGLSLSLWWYRRLQRKNLWAVLQVALGGLLVVILGVALAGPSVPEESPVTTSNVEIVVAVDRTGSMAAEDGPGGEPRLTSVKRDVAAIAKTAADARFAIVTWDSSARVELPFTTDTSAVVSFSDSLHQEVSEFSTGSALDWPVPTLERLLTSAKEARPANTRFLIVMTDGENTQVGGDQTDDVSPWAALTPLIDGGAVIGYGTEAGGPMKLFLAGGAQTDEYMTDMDGSPAISVIDPVTLDELATTLGVPLLVNPSEEQVEAEAQKIIDTGISIEDDRKVEITYRYYTWVPALFGGVVVAFFVYGFVTLLTHWRNTNAL